MGNIKTRTPNTWIHELTPQTLVLRLIALPVGTFSSNKHTKQQSVNILIRDTYIWVGFPISVFSRWFPFSGSKNDKYPLQAWRKPGRKPERKLPSFGRWSHTAPTRLGPTETWLARKKTSAILDSHSAGMRRSFAQIYYFVLVFLNVFSKRCCEGLYHWWRHELC